MLAWLIPVAFFFVIISIYLGGLSITVVGGNGVRQIVAVIATMVIYLAVWWIARRALGAVGHGVITEVVLPTAVAIALLPLATRLGFIVLGMRLGKESTAH